MKIKIVFSVCLLFLIGSFRAKAWFFTAPSMPAAKQGVIDLRAESFTEKVALDGEWEFYWKQLLGPETKVAHRGIYTDLPFMWNDYVLNGKRLPGFGYASYRLNVLLPKTEKQLRIAMPDAYSAYAVYVNGKQEAANGKVSP